MPVPKRKTCKWKRDQRRAHIKLHCPKLVPFKTATGEVEMVPQNLLKSYQEGILTPKAGI